MAAAVSGLTYKSRDRDHLFEAASLLRSFADRVEQDGLASLEWSYQGKLDARQAWRPDIRTDEGLAELDKRTDAIIEGMMRPLRALTSPERRAIVCMSFVRMALVHVGDLIDQHPDEAVLLSNYCYGKLVPHIEKVASRVEADSASPGANMDRA